MLQVTWHNPFWINFFILWSLLYSQVIWAQETPLITDSTGIIRPLVRAIQDSKNELKSFKKNIKANSTKIIDQENIKDFRIVPIQMSSILLFTSSKYLTWAGADYCRFLSLLENQLVRDAQGVVTRLILQTENSVSKEKEILFVNIQRFLRISYANHCITNQNIQTLFKKSNIVRTLKKLNLNPMTTRTACRKQCSKLRKNDLVPHLCEIVEQKKRLKSYLKRKNTLTKQNKTVPFSLLRRIKKVFHELKVVTKSQQSFLKEFCSDLDSKDNFCSKQLDTDLWKEVQSGQRPEYLLSYLCSSLSKKKKTSKASISECISLLRSSPQVCLTANYYTSPSLLPHPDCTTLEKNLTPSHLYTDYEDCPGFMSNTYITNAARIIKHFKKQKEVNTKNIKKKTAAESCTDTLYKELAELYYKFDKNKKFDTKICFMSPIIQLRKCIPYLPGAANVPQSEANVLSKVLFQLRGISESTKCRMANFNKFNPRLLEYKNGCVIAYKKKDCTTSGCPKNIYYNSRKINGISYEGKLKIEYRPLHFNNTQYAINRQIKKVYKLNEKKIHNLTEAVFFLNLNKNNIIHGVGCAEDIYPSKFPRRTMNQCRILPFIIDGHRTENNQTFLITRTAIDDLHSPRAINWVFLYSAIKSYQQIHPLRNWTLYGIRK